jgi:hypothetical protein
VLTTVLYGSEAWTCTNEQYQRLNVFHTKKLRSIVKKKRDEISNEKLFKLTGMCPLEDVIRKYRLRWAGHVRRMDDNRLPKKVLFGEIKGGSKGRGRQKKNWMNCVEEDCAKANVVFSKWTGDAKERVKWQKTISYLTSAKGK